VYQANLLRSNPIAAGKVSGVGLLVFFLCVLAGAGATAATKSPAYVDGLDSEPICVKTKRGRHPWESVFRP
jgi:hypothetical protein